MRICLISLLMLLCACHTQQATSPTPSTPATPPPREDLTPRARAALASALTAARTASVQTRWEERRAHDPKLALTHGLAAAEVTHERATIWSRAGQTATMFVRLIPAKGPSQVLTAPSRPTADHTAQLTWKGLTPKTEYRYRVWLEHEGRRGPFREGRFRTAPSPKEPARVRFAWSGDLGGQNICRDVERGYPIFDTVPRDLDFFLALGDMIYADNTCRPKGRFKNPQVPGLLKKARALEEFWFAWRYNRADPGHQKLLADMPYFAIWDDHEVVNDFGPKHNRTDRPPHATNQELLPVGQRAFRHYNPITLDPKDPDRLYRTVRWGKHVELFVLDTRQYRDANSDPDTRKAPKSMLGQAQFDWLIREMKSSTATWKFVLSSVPMSIPTGTYPESNGRDGWADLGYPGSGFERELTRLVDELARAGVQNTIWLTTDVHFAAAFAYKPFPKKHPSFVSHEFVAGPLSAYLFPNRNYDKSLGAKQLFFHGPVSGRNVKTLEQALNWFNIGVLEVDPNGTLALEYRDGHGKQLYTLKLKPR